MNSLTAYHLPSTLMVFIKRAFSFWLETKDYSIFGEPSYAADIIRLSEMGFNVIQVKFSLIFITKVYINTVIIISYIFQVPQQRDGCSCVLYIFNITRKRKRFSATSVAESTPKKATVITTKRKLSPVVIKDMTKKAKVTSPLKRRRMIKLQSKVNNKFSAKNIKLLPHQSLNDKSLDKNHSTNTDTNGHLFDYNHSIHYDYAGEHSKVAKADNDHHYNLNMDSEHAYDNNLLSRLIKLESLITDLKQTDEKSFKNKSHDDEKENICFNTKEFDEDSSFNNKVNGKSFNNKALNKNTNSMDLNNITDDNDHHWVSRKRNHHHNHHKKNNHHCTTYSYGGANNDQPAKIAFRMTNMERMVSEELQELRFMKNLNSAMHG